MANLPEDPDEYVTVREFFESGEALVAKGALESAGVECFVVNENFSRMYGGALSVLLQVHRKDEEAAMQILGSADGEPDTEELTADEGTDGEG
jgi:hypothetical protein